MKHQFKQGDGVICQSIEQKKELLQLAKDNGYETNKISLESNSINLHWSGDEFSGLYEDELYYLTNPIPPEQFIKLVTQNTFVLPEKWCVKVTEESVSTLAEFYAKHAWEGYIQEVYNYTGKYCTSHNVSGGKSVFKHDCGSNFNIEHPDQTFQEITFKQFKSHVLNQNTMTKEIIGYKLIKPEYREAAESIVGKFSNIFIEYNFQTDLIMYHELKKAGVLDLWFEPVYKEDKLIQIPQSVIEGIIHRIETYLLTEEQDKLIQELKQYINK